MPECCELLIAEHRRTEELVDRLEAMLKKAVSPQVAFGEAGEGNVPSWLSIRKLYGLLAQDLQRHFALEEQALFSVLNQYRTMMLMEVEHDDLLALQADFAAHLSGVTEHVPNNEAVLTSFAAFRERLYAHMVEEERGIFPLAEAKLEPEEKLKVLRLYNELLERWQSDTLSLNRPAPGFQVSGSELFAPVDRPMAYQTLYEREHTSIQHIRLQAGQKQSPHWAGQHQCIIVLSGQVVFETATESHTLVSGDRVNADSRLVFSLAAIKDTQLLVFKVWPHPHYAKT